MASSPVKMTVSGVEVTVQNINREIAGIQGRTPGGMLRAGYLVLGESNRRVPYEYGNLMRSGYVKLDRTGSEPGVEVGYSSPYAIYVHENMEMKLRGRTRRSGKGTYWSSSGGGQGRSKFLESAAKDLQDDVVDTVADAARIRG